MLRSLSSERNVSFEMVKISNLAFAAAAMAAPAPKERAVCPQIPGNAVLGPAVPMVPANIPIGCSAYEVLVGRSIFALS